MRRTDVAIAGGGLAGSIAAAMLGRDGYNVVMCDPRPVYPPDFRCEKIDGPQMRVLEKTGLADAVRRASTPDRETWIANLGYVVEKRPGDQHGILYDTLVNTIRAEIPQSVSVIHARVTEIANGAGRQRVKLSNGEQISARLVIVANGLNPGLSHKLGIERHVLSANHSISIGFDIEPAGRPSFEFSSVSCYSERASEQIAYLTLFPIGSTMRANLFVYRDLHDPWLKRLRDAPVETMCAAMPRLRNIIGEFEVTGFVKIRPIDLYVTRGYDQPGIVLAGDAFSSSCPAAGTGALKVFTDVERLCNIFIPRWLATPGMGEEKIGAFYSDPVKMACEAHSLAKAYDLRTISIGASLPVAARRGIRFAGQLGRGALRHAYAQITRTRGRQAGDTAIGA